MIEVIREILAITFDHFWGTVWEVVIALSPIVVIFLVLQVVTLRIKRKQFLQIMKGFVFVFTGLVFFMQGVHIAFVPMGNHLGEKIAAVPYNWILIPIGFVMGFLVAFAEPAVHVMIKQVEEMSTGAIKAVVMLIAISIGVAVAVALGMVKILYGISLWWFLVPGYILVFILSRYTDLTFVAMAFDNGGVATGPMCSTFLLAMCVSIAGQLDGVDPLLDGFGMVALIALAPIITTMMLSFLYRRKAPKRPVRNKEENALTEL